MLEGHLPLSTAWELMLSEDERSELPFDEFVADVTAFLEGQAAAGDADDSADGQAATAASRASRSISLSRALAYLQENS